MKANNPTVRSIELREVFERLAATMPEDEWEIVCQKFVDQRTILEIAGEFGIHACTVEEIVRRALHKLRHPIRARFAFQYWEGKDDSLLAGGFGEDVVRDENEIHQALSHIGPNARSSNNHP